MGTITTLSEERILELAAGWEAVASDMDTLNGQFSDISTNLAENQAAIDLFNTVTLPNLELALGGNDAAVSELNDVTIPGLNATLGEHTSALENLNTVTLPGLSSELEGLGESITTLNETTLPAMQADLDALNSLDLPALASSITDLNTSINDLNTVVLPGMQSQLDTNTGNLDTLNTTTLPGLSASLSLVEDKFPIGTVDIQDGAITADKVLADSITAVQIAAHTITALEIAADTITANEIAADTITANEIAADSITASEIASHTITANEIAADTITANEIAADTITANEIATDAITANEIAANAVTANEIAADAVTTNKLQAEAVTAAKIATDTITANQIATDAITANEIAAHTITASEIAADTITANEIAADTITANEIAADTITASEIAAGAITANEIAADAITADQIAAGTITATEIAAGAIKADLLTTGTLKATTVITVEGSLQVLGKDSSGALNGAGIFMDGTSGFRVVGVPASGSNEGPTYISFPVSGAPNIISGTLNADFVTVTQGATLRGTSKIEQSAALQLQDKVGSPLAPPSIETTYFTKSLANPLSTGITKMNGLGFGNVTISTVSNSYLFYSSTDQLTSGYRLNRVRADGSTSANNTSVAMPAGCVGIDGVAFVGSSVWVIGHGSSNVGMTGNTWKMTLWKFDAVTMALQGTYDSPITESYVANNGNYYEGNVALSYGQQQVSLFTDGTDLYVPYIAANGLTLKIAKVTTASPTAVSATYSSTVTLDSVTGGYYGLADWGTTNRFIICDWYGDVMAAFTLSGTTLTRVTAYEWEPANTPFGLVYDGTNFWSLNETGLTSSKVQAAKITRYSRNVWYGSESSKWWGVYAWYNGVNVTDVSPAGSVTMKKRAELKITGAVNTAYSARFSLARKATTPTLAEYVVQSTTATGVNYEQYENATFTGTAPTTSTFSSSTGNPGKIYAEALDTETTNPVSCSSANTTVTWTGTGAPFRPNWVGRAYTLVNASSVVIGSGTVTAVATSGKSLTISSAPTSTGTNVILNVFSPTVEIKGDGAVRIGALSGYKAVLYSTVDANTSSGNEPPLRVGNPYGGHLRIDGNEIIAMSSDTTNDQGVLLLNSGGKVQFGGQTWKSGLATAPGGSATAASFIDVSWGTPAFIGTPFILLSNQDSVAAASTIITCWATNITSTGFRLNVMRNTTSATTVRWLAIDF